MPSFSWRVLEQSISIRCGSIYRLPSQNSVPCSNLRQVWHHSGLCHSGFGNIKGWMRTWCTSEKPCCLLPMEQLSSQNASYSCNPDFRNPSGFTLPLFLEGDRFLFSSSDTNLAHALAVQGCDVLDGPPWCGRVHEGDRLVCCGSAAGPGADLACCSFGQTAISQQSPQRSVIVPPCTLAQAHAKLKEHNLIWVITHPQVPHSHLTPLQVAVTAALAPPIILILLLFFLLLLLFLAWAFGLSIRGIWGTWGTLPPSRTVFLD